MKAKGKWQVWSQVFDGIRKYIVGRIIDTSQVQHGGNMEYVPGMGYIEDKEHCEEFAAELNSKDEAAQ